MRTLRIGTRGSALALWQARAVAARLAGDGVDAEIVIIATTGDRLQQAPLADVGGKRLFVKEIEDALLRGDIDLAVHSAKDMPAESPEGLGVAAVLPREDPRDALVLPASTQPGEIDHVLARLGSAPLIGTGSVRRIAQITSVIPGARFAPIRGNVDTRVRKLDAGEYGVLVLAAAGLRRLGLGARITAALPIDLCIPAPGQGIVAMETRTDDEGTRRVVRHIGDAGAALSLAAEQAVVAALGGGCQLPLGAIARQSGGGLDLLGIVAAPDGSRRVTRQVSGASTEPEALGRRLAEALAAGGGREILDEVRRGG